MKIPDVSPDLPPRTWRLILSMLGRLPQGVMSRSFGRIADIPLARPLRRPVLGAFARAVGIDLSEAELPIEAYGSLNHFFVRGLKPGIRRWPDDPAMVASPVDGIVGQVGRIEDGRLIQAKGRWYSAGELLGSDDEAARFDGGSFATLYLSPRHYHRIHAPVAGVIHIARHLPGALLPVNEPAVAHVADLFVRNERLLCHIDGERGRAAVVAVGAYNVGRISTAFDPAWRGRGMGGTSRTTHAYDPPVLVGRGDEIMAFHLGSTVVLLLEAAAGSLRTDLRAGAPILLGEALMRE
jgi:phosphatidylserine decarboxylase